MSKQITYQCDKCKEENLSHFEVVEIHVTTMHESDCEYYGPCQEKRQIELCEKCFYKMEKDLPAGIKKTEVVE